jgi:hypothetical protein
LLKLCAWAAALALTGAGAPTALLASGDLTIIDLPRLRALAGPGIYAY